MSAALFVHCGGDLVANGMCGIAIVNTNTASPCEQCGLKVIWYAVAGTPCLLYVVVLQIGEAVLRSYVFIHLEQPADKLQLLLAMMHKLYAMITRQCCDDNPDGLIHHEVSLLLYDR